MSSALASGYLRQEFPHTRWSVVLAATGRPSPASRAALEHICRGYWYPLYAFVRRSGHSPHDAQDLTQEFFRLLLEKRWLATADREKGRLRTFLITAIKHFMAKEWRRASAQRRGGGVTFVSIDAGDAETRYAAEPAAQLATDEIFDRQWAMTLLGLTLARLESEFAQANKAREYSVLKSCLAAERGTIDYDALAAQLGHSPGAARVAAHRLRKRFRDIYREEVADTLGDDAVLEAEVRHLAQALGRA